MAAKALDWTWNEEVLAFDLYLRIGGSPGEGRPEVKELSDYLRSLTIYPVDQRLPEFRNPPGVRRKLGDIHSHAPGYIGKLTSGSVLDRLLWETYGGRTDEIPALAEQIRLDAISFTVPEPDEQEVADLSLPEGHFAFRAHRTRERSAKLRREKLKQFRKKYGTLSCEACHEDLMGSTRRSVVVVLGFVRLGELAI